MRLRRTGTLYQKRPYLFYVFHQGRRLDVSEVYSNDMVNVQYFFYDMFLK